MSANDPDPQLKADIQRLLDARRPDLNAAATALDCLVGSLEVRDSIARALQVPEHTGMVIECDVRACTDDAWTWDAARYRPYREIRDRYATRCRATAVEGRARVASARIAHRLDEIEALAHECRWIEVTETIGALERRILEGDLGGAELERARSRVARLREENAAELQRAERFLQSAPVVRLRQQARALDPELGELIDHRSYVSDCPDGSSAYRDTCPGVAAERDILDSQIASLRREKARYEERIRELAHQTGVAGCSSGARG